MSKVKKFSTKLDAGLSAAQVLADSMASHHLVQQLYNNGKGLVVTNHMNGITQKRPHSAISPVKSNGHSTGLVQNAINGLNKNTNGNVIINGAINGSSNGSAHQQPSILKSKSIVPPPISAESSSMSSILNNSADYADQFSGFSILADAASAAASVNGSTSSSFDTTPFHTPSKRRKTDSKNGKGLRHFSMKVCEKVKVKGVTTYNEVADELVAEFTADPQMGLGGGGFGEGEPFDQKNIRRRVYDALNVLMAMNIISKEKKEIRWIGLPSNCTQECYELEREKQERIKRIDLKKQQLRDLLVQQIAFKNLVERNRNFSTPPSTSAIIQLPFIIVNTDKRTVIDCSISNDKTEYLFNFDNTFEIHDDIEVLKRIGLACGLDKDGDRELDHKKLDKIRQMLPEALRAELDEMIEQKMRHSDGNALTDSQAPSDLVITNSELDSSSFYSITSATH